LASFILEDLPVGTREFAESADKGFAESEAAIRYAINHPIDAKRAATQNQSRVTVRLTIFQYLCRQWRRLMRPCSSHSGTKCAANRTYSFDNRYFAIADDAVGNGANESRSKIFNEFYQAVNHNRCQTSSPSDTTRRDGPLRIQQHNQLDLLIYAPASISYR